MATSKNDITGDTISTKPVTDQYRENWEKIFGNKTNQKENNQNSKEETGVDQEDECKMANRV